MRSLPPLLAGLLYAFGSLIVLTLFISLLLTWTNMMESDLSSYVIGVHGLSLLVGGFAAGRRTSHRGWYLGGMLSLIYVIIVVGIGFLAFDQGLALSALILLLVCALSGALGGIVGVNMRQS